jgi:DNA ligase (NAD+)
MFATHSEELDYLKKLGFVINPLNQSAKNLKGIWEIAENLKNKRENLKYPIDGLVIKLDDNILVEKLGVVGKTHRGWGAIKFSAKETVTKLVDISWQIGRTGKITPVAELEAVELDGSVVKRATLHNFQDFSEKKLKLGTMLSIRKAGDIIPEVLSVITYLHPENPVLKAPEFCPSCGTKLVFSETLVDIFCPNQDFCREQILGRLIYFCQRNIANITGLSEKNLAKFQEVFELEDVADIYDLPLEKIKIMEGFGEKSVENLEKSVENARNLQDYRFLAGLAVEGIGIENAKLICELIDNLAENIEFSEQSVNILEDKKTENISNNNQSLF